MKEQYQNIEIEQENSDNEYISYSIDESQLNMIIDFINNNFKTSDISSVLLNNYRLLLRFIKNHKYTLNIVDAEKLFLCCPILKDVIKTVIEYKIPKTFALVELFNMYDILGFEQKCRKLENQNDYEADEDLDLLALYYRDIGTVEVYSREEEIEMFRRYHAGSQEAYEDIIHHNLRFVIYKAKKYLGKGLPLEDLIQEGNVGLLEAVQKFDETKGYKFSSYSAWWIEKCIKRAIVEKVRRIKLPNSVFYKNKDLFSFLDEFQELNGRLPTYEEIEKSTGVDKELFIILYNLCGDTQSLDVKTINNEKNSLGDVIIDENSYVDEIVIRYTISRLIKEYINKTELLSERDKKILYYKYRDYLTLEEIARIFHLTKEGVRYVLNSSLEKLKYDTEFLKLVPDEYKKEVLKRKAIESKLRHSARKLTRGNLK